MVKYFLELKKRTFIVSKLINKNFIIIICLMKTMLYQLFIENCSVWDVLSNGQAEQWRLLRHEAHLTAQPLDTELAHIDAVNGHRAAIHVVEAQQ